MKKSPTILFCLLFLAPIAGAQMEKGDQEVRASGYMYLMDSFTMLQLQLTYGYYLEHNIQIGVGPSVSYMGENSTSFSASFFGRYYFTPHNQLVPYVGAQWYQSDFSPEEGTSFTDNSFIQVGGGIKYFLNEYIAYDVSANYGFGLGGGGGILYISGGVSALF